jgi:hypothetical protein
MTISLSTTTSPNPGFIYVLENKFIPSIYKICGCVDESSIVLESPLVPVPFTIKYIVRVCDWEETLQSVYNILKYGAIAKNFYKVSEDILASIFLLMGNRSLNEDEDDDNEDDDDDEEDDDDEDDDNDDTDDSTVEADTEDDEDTEDDDIDDNANDVNEYNYLPGASGSYTPKTTESSMDENDLENEYVALLIGGNQGMSQIRGDEYGDITNCLKSGYVIKHVNSVAGTYWYGVYESERNIVLSGNASGYRRGGHVCPIQDFCVAHMNTSHTEVDDNEWSKCTVFTMGDNRIFYKNLGELVKDYWRSMRM